MVLKKLPLTVSGLTVVCIVLSYLTVINYFKIDQTVELPAQMTRTVIPAPVTVPDGSTVLTVFVEEGEKVDRGQTLLLLDALPIEAALQSTGAGLYRTKARLNCLRKISKLTDFDEIAPKNCAFLFVPPDELRSEVKVDCKTQQQILTLNQAENERTIENLNDRLKLIERSLGLAKRFSLPPVGAGGPENARHLRRILDLSLAHNLASSELERARSNYRSKTASESHARNSEIVELEKDALEKTLQMNTLRRQAGQARVYALSEGIVRNLRQNSAGVTFFHNETVMRIDPTEKSVFNVSFPLEEYLAEQLIIGQPVELKIYGIPAHAPKLFGYIKKISTVSTTPSQKQHMIGHAVLSDQSREVLNSRKIGMAALSGNMASAVDISIPGRTMKSRAYGTIVTLGKLRQTTSAIFNQAKDILLRH